VSTDRSAPIGVFDSGVGGLSVLGALQRALPNEDLLYLGDTARVPYGSKPAAMVREFAFELADELIGRGAKALVIACNSASSVSLPELAQRAPVPVWGVIEPGLLAARDAAGSQQRPGTIGVIGTQRTIEAASYQGPLAREGYAIWARACPLFVPIVEEGVADGAIAALVAEHYLRDRPRDLTSLILGCTHYPALKTTLQRICGPEVALIDTAETTAKYVAAELRARSLARSEGATPGKVTQLVTGDLANYRHVAALLGGPVGETVPLPLPLTRRSAWRP
jgi:glutamate racemase